MRFHRASDPQKCLSPTTTKNLNFTSSGKRVCLVRQQAEFKAQTLRVPLLCYKEIKTSKLEKQNVRVERAFVVWPYISFIISTGIFTDGTLQPPGVATVKNYYYYFITDKHT